LNNSEGKGGGHTLVEYADGVDWKVIAPSDNAFVWRDASGKIVGTRDLRQHPEIFAQIYSSIPNYPYLFDNPHHINWTKVPVWIQNVLQSTMSKERFANLQTPKLYDNPRHLLLNFLTILFTFSMIGAVVTTRSLRTLRAGHADTTPQLVKRSTYRKIVLQDKPVVSGGYTLSNQQTLVD
jgi:hypothetical protein